MKAILIAIPDAADTSGRSDDPRPSCANCRFRLPPGNDRHYSMCSAFDELEPNARFGAVEPNDSGIWVTDDFGCVQWEGKP